MKEKNCELLFEYLKSILQDRERKALDIRSLDEPYRELGRGLQLLRRTVDELLDYSKELSRGNLSAEMPPKENFLCENLKDMQANLSHLIWQARQVAAGDYSQKIAYMGEFSDVFNLMTEQLKEREAQLRDETEKVRQRARTIQAYNELLIEMNSRRNEWILVVDAEERDIIYCSKSSQIETPGETYCKSCQCRLTFHDRLKSWKSEGQVVWEEWGGEGIFYQINSFPVEWSGRQAYVHILSDMTKINQERAELASKAYIDPGTGIRNRRFFEEHMRQLLREQKQATLCYLDIDGLKYVNDNYGHPQGDRYILSFVEKLQSSFRKEDIFARIGGDEFAVVLLGCHEELAKRKLAEARRSFIAENRQEYPVGFSYGVYQIMGEQEALPLDRIIRKADNSMYKFKRRYKGIHEIEKR